ncbi:unnamed protein product, partial [Ectocarpus sp. 6 AP-2014]
MVLFGQVFERSYTHVWCDSMFGTIYLVLLHRYIDRVLLPVEACLSILRCSVTPFLERRVRQVGLEPSTLSVSFSPHFFSRVENHLFWRESFMLLAAVFWRSRGRTKTPTA